MMTVRKLLTVLIILTLLCQASCTRRDSAPDTGSYSSAGITDNKTEVNSIKPYAFSSSERALDKVLVGGEAGANVYSYNASENLSVCSVWFKEYRKGELVRTWPVKLELDKTRRDGLISIVLADNIKIGISSGSSSVLFTEEFNKKSTSDSDSGFWENKKSITEAKALNGFSIDLLVYAAGPQNAQLESPEFYVQNPDEISNFESFYIFQCNFR